VSERGTEFANAERDAGAPWRVALVGCGAIGCSRHLPVLRSHPRFELAALVDPLPQAGPVPGFESLAAALDSGVELDAAVIATPPQVRAAIAREAMAAGLAVLLEKPPAASVAEALELKALAKRSGTTLFAAWHSRFAPMASAAADWLRNHQLVGGRMTWREDVCKWHPGQDWIWRAGGLGAFDPGINGFSLLTSLHPGPLDVADVRFRVHRGADTPVVVDMVLKGEGFEMPVALDLQATDGETWCIDLLRDDGRTAVLDKGGACWRASGGSVVTAPEREYEGVYHRFAELIEDGSSDVDLQPLQLVEAAFAVADIERLDAPPPGTATSAAGCR
jgi:predicted dehydrogenase